jgi:hypothetical protein
MSNYTIGSDPEMVILQNGKPTCSIPVLDNRGKHDKIDLGDGATIYYDNALSEGTIKPADSAEGLVESFRDLFTKASNYLKPKNAQLAAIASVEFPIENLKDYPGAMMFGCDPEADMWEKCECSPPFCPPDSGFRSAGGHIHIGRKDYKTADEEAFLISLDSKVRVIRAMDVIVGTALTAIENDPSAPARKKLYGKAGRARYNLPYGAEYRTPGNGWTAMPEKVALVYDLTMFALDFAQENASMLDDKQGLPFDDIIDTINTGDSNRAFSLLSLLPNKGFISRIKDLANLPYNPIVTENYAI